MKNLFRSLIVLAASSSLALASDENWMTDWEAAKVKAKAENKPIFLNLTGSDWCVSCIKLHKEVFSQQAFKDYAAQNVILFEADVPKKPETLAKQSEALKAQNAMLEKEYLNRAFPTVLILDAEGKKLSEDIGELEGGTDAYIAKIKEVIASQKK